MKEKKEPLKVGDRVAVYMPRGRRIGIIKEISDTGNVCVYAPYDPESALPELCSFFHPKQCRRIKPPRKAREWQLNKTLCSDKVWRDMAAGPVLGYGESLIVREVLPKRAKA